MLAYPLSRKDFVGGRYLMMLVSFTMIFNGGIIPTYLVVKELKLIKTMWAMTIPVAITGYNTIITRTFFMHNIPDELFEAAKIDGCSNFKFITSVVLPLSKSIVAVIGLFYAVGHWNAYFSALIYLRDEAKYPLQMVLRQLLIQNQTNELVDVASQSKGEYLEALLKYGVIIVSILPMLMVYPFIQKFFVKGVMVGSLKG
jgi:ABC-type glycerol-3-phosphate transport system permease component